MRTATLVAIVVALSTLGSATLAHAEDLFVHIYNVSDLLRAPRDFPAPKLGLEGIEEAEVDPFGDDEEENGAMFTGDELVELIEQHIQPERWERAGNSVHIHKGNLIIVASDEAHRSIAKNIGRWRVTGPPRAYTITTRCVPIDADGLAALGFKATSKRDSRVVDAEIVARLTSDQKATIQELPSRRVIERQESHVSLLNQTAYVADAELDEESGVVDPVIEVLQEGVTFETSVRRRGSKRVLVTWKANVARHTSSEFKKIHDTQVELPEVELIAKQGRTVVKEGRFLVIRGLPHPDPEVADDFIWIVGVERAAKPQKR